LFGFSQRPAIQGLLSCFVAVSVSDLYYITRVCCICQHLFEKKSKKGELFSKSLSSTMFLSSNRKDIASFAPFIVSLSQED
ncbi:hypothetical protein, partial [Selenomonas ruminantium]|uniref:hypothetical protein n=1 Tax=Selenomonas ruminantium TaxID=971 RepID=UPI001C409116